MKRLIFTFILFIAHGLLAENPYWLKGTPVLEQEKLTGSWAGYRQSLEEHGFTFAGSYEMGYSKNLQGGIDTEGDSNKQRLTLSLSLDTEKLLNWKGGTLFFQYQNHTGAFGTDEVGDIQQFDGLDDPEYDRIHMFWYEQWLFDGLARIKVGKVEPKSEFFAPLFAKNHLGFSTERSPTIGHGPPADSINLFIYPTKDLEFGLGVYDAAFNEGRDENTMKLSSQFGSVADRFYIGEGRYSWNNDGYNGRFMAGYWMLDGDSNKLNGSGTESSTGGGYFVLDQKVYKENSDDDQGIGVYLQYGFADEDVRSIKAHYGAGFQWVGAIPNRDLDVWGMGISHIELSDENSSFSDDYERAHEIFYKAFLTPYSILQGDLQYIENPGGVGREDALVYTVRLTLLF